MSGAGGRSLTYGHDALGNLLNRTSSATADADVALSGHLSTATAAPGPHAPRFATVGTERRGLAYDAAGRLTSATVCAASSGACAAKSGADHRFVTWNARGEAERVLVGGSATDATPEAREDFARGPDGGLYFRKSAWREDGAERVERRYVVGGFEDVVPASPTARFERVRKTRVTDTVLHVRKKPRGGAEVSSFEYLHRDHLGSVTAVTDAACAVSRQAAHDPFGARRASDWARAQTAAERAAWADYADARTTEGFSAHRQLDRTGLVDMGGRLYDPELGLFLSPDPLVAEPASSQGWNPYSYVGNRPLSRVDPSGFSIAPTGCNLGDTACLRRRASGGWGGFTPAPAWSVSVRLGVRFRLRVNFGFDIDLGWRSWFTYEPSVVVNLEAKLVGAGADKDPADRALEKEEAVLRSPSRRMSWDHPQRRRALILSRITVTSWVRDGEHYYRISGLICRGGSVGCDGELRQAVYETLNAMDVPYSNDDVGAGPKDVHDQPITHEEFPQEFRSKNTTRPGHIFHRGGVDFGVPQDSVTGDIRVEIIGTGTGPYPSLNTFLGKDLFQGTVYRVMWRHMDIR